MIFQHTEGGWPPECGSDGYTVGSPYADGVDSQSHWFLFSNKQSGYQSTTAPAKHLRHHEAIIKRRAGYRRLSNTPSPPVTKDSRFGFRLSCSLQGPADIWRSLYWTQAIPTLSLSLCLIEIQ
jgi:hypothetical protein